MAIAITKPRTNPNPPPSSRSNQRRPVAPQNLSSDQAMSPPAATQPIKIATKAANFASASLATYGPSSTAPRS